MLLFDPRDSNLIALGLIVGHGGGDSSVNRDIVIGEREPASKPRSNPVLEMSGYWG
jgi:hypothetical protein